VKTVKAHSQENRRLSWATFRRMLLATRGISFDGPLLVNTSKGGKRACFATTFASLTRPT
jgi:hypothetical protein